jgi:hypothetical protein
LVLLFLLFKSKPSFFVLDLLFEDEDEDEGFDLVDDEGNIL